MSLQERYNLSFEAHYRLVTIHPWADGNGRMARLITDDISHFLEFITEEMIKILSSDIAIFLKSMNEGGEIIKVSGEKKQKSREKILSLLEEHPDYSARKLAEVIGITQKAVEKHLSKLKTEGLIRRDGPDKGGK